MVSVYTPSCDTVLLNMLSRISCGQKEHEKVLYLEFSRVPVFAEMSELGWTKTGEYFYIRTGRTELGRPQSSDFLKYSYRDLDTRQTCIYITLIPTKRDSSSNCALARVLIRIVRLAAEFFLTLLTEEFY
jgi:hypothetical protein